MLSFYKGLKIKILFKESPIFGPGEAKMWLQIGLKMAKKGYFHTKHLTPNPVFCKFKIFNSHSDSFLRH